MKQYLALLKEVLHTGQREPNRTGIDTLTIPGAMLKFDMRDGFPAVTTKQLAFKQVVGELIGFLRGHDSAADFRALGCKVWDQNANENAAWLKNPRRNGVDDLGRIYGTQWRDFRYENSESGLVISIDQIATALEQVRHNPTSRRIIVNAWNPGEVADEYAALPPCHVLFQLMPRSDNTLHMMMYMRSCDMFLGVPFNIASYALLLHLFAAWSGRTPATLTMALADVHIYENHLSQVCEQLTREPMQLPTLKMDLIGSSVDGLTHNCKGIGLDLLLDDLAPHDFCLVDYNPHPPIKAPMAV